jgi:hypothetical protein
VLLCIVAAPAAAQTNLQFWGDVSLNWLRTDRLAYALDLEPQALVASWADRRVDAKASPS